MIVVSWAAQKHLVLNADSHEQAFSGEGRTFCGRTPRRVEGSASYKPGTVPSCKRCRGRLYPQTEGENA